MAPELLGTIKVDARLRLSRIKDQASAMTDEKVLPILLSAGEMHFQGTATPASIKRALQSIYPHTETELPSDMQIMLTSLATLV